MKRLLTILVFISLASCSKSQFAFHLAGSVVSNVVSDVKNIQAVNNPTVYEAFGFPVQNKENQVTLYTNNAITHTTGAYPVYRTFNIAARVWKDPVTIAAQDSLYSPITAGGQMDNDSTVLFIVKNHTDIYHSRDIYIQKCDSNNNFNTPVLFNWTGITQLQSGFFFGPLIHGDSPGESYATMYQVNGDTGTTRYRITIFKTTDYWNHYTEQGVIHDDGALDYSETAAVNLGSGKFLALARKNNSGSLTPFESTNYGVTWTRRPSSNLTWYTGGAPEIPGVFQHDGVFDVFYENRDATMMYISKGNSLSNFGSGGPYNESEIYAYHKGTGGNPSLGYGSGLKLRNSNLYLTIYFKEYTTTRANIQWTIDDLTTDPNGVPSAPTFVTSGITTTSFKVDSLFGFNDTVFQNVRYFLIDLSTQANFSSFVTAKYRAVSAYSASVIHDTRALAGFVLFNSLTTGTTYYFRIKACNNAGCSAYTTTSVTTL